MTEIKKEAIDSAIREIECSGLCGNQMHKETLETALAALYRTAEHDKAMEEGRLVELPCKSGDKIYNIASFFGWLKEPEEHLVNGFYSWRGDLTIICAGATKIGINKIGKTVFLTRQEAEEAMQKKNKEYPCRGHECYDRGNFHTSCGECPLYGKEAALDGGGEQC